MKKICFFVLSLALFCGLTSCSNGLGMASVRIPVDFSELVASRNGDERMQNLNLISGPYLPG